MLLFFEGTLFSLLNLSPSFLGNHNNNRSLSSWTTRETSTRWSRPVREEERVRSFFFVSFFFFFCSRFLFVFVFSLASLSLALSHLLFRSFLRSPQNPPGGKVVVYTGLLRILQSEKELAAVLAHEVAHILARHTAEKLTSMQAASLARMILYWAFGIPLPLGALELALFLPNSRAAETEADVIGVRLAARACYDPSAAATVFEKLGEAERRAGGDGIPAFMRTHPLSDRRVKRVRAELPAAMLLYEKAGCSLPRSALRQFVNVLTGEEEEVEIAGVKGRGGRGTEGDVGDDDDPLARLFK